MSSPNDLRKANTAPPSAATQLSHAAQGWFSGGRARTAPEGRKRNNPTPYRGGRVWLRGYPDPNGEPWKSLLDECQGRFPMRVPAPAAPLTADMCGPDTRRRWAIPWGARESMFEREIPPECKAEGQGLVRTVTGILHSFTVKVMNPHKLKRPVLRDEVGIYVRSGPGTPTFYLNEVGEDEYRVDWVASMSGTYVLQVSCRGFPVAGSPFSVTSEAAYTTAEHSSAEGPGLVSTVAGKESQFVIRARDQMTNCRVSGGDDMRLDFTGPAKLRRVELDDRKDGTYDVTYVANVVGTYRVEIRFQDDPVAGSPYQFTVAPDVCSGPACTVEGLGASEAEAGVTASFTIQARDRFGNNIEQGGETFHGALIKGPIKDKEIPVQVLDKGDGTYLITYEVERNGKYELQMKHRNVDCRYPRPVVAVRPGRTSGDQCIVTEPGVPYRVMAGDYLRFNIVAHDAFGNRRPHGGDTFRLIITSSDEDEMVVVDDACVVDNGDGTYTPQWRAARLGKFYTSVRLETVGEDEKRHQTSIPNSPFLTTVVPGEMDISCCTAEGEGLSRAVAGATTTFTIQAKDRFGNTVTHGGRDFEVEIMSHADDRLEVEAEVRDNNNGTYSVTYVVEQAGQYDVYVLCDEQMITPFAYNLEVVPGKTSGRHCLLQGLATLVAVAGVPTSVILIAKDEWSNRQLEGSDQFSVDLKLVPGTHDTQGELPEPISAAVHDNQDGTYLMSFTPRVSGQYRCMLYHDGKLVSKPEDVCRVQPGDLHPPVCRVIGEGCERCVAGDAGEFTVVAADRHLNRVQVGGVALSARLLSMLDAGGSDASRGSPDAVVPCMVVDLDDGSFLVRYRATTAGEYLLEISFRGDPVPELARDVSVTPGLTAPGSCTVVGSGLRSAQVGSASRFTVEARDGWGNLRDSGGDTFLVSLKLANSEYHRTHSTTNGSVADNGDGTYSVVYHPTMAGEFVMFVTCTSRGRPATFHQGRVRVEPSSPHGPTSKVAGYGLDGEVRAGVPVTCALVVEDRRGNPVGADGAGELRAEFVGGDKVGSTTICPLEGGARGVYNVVYKAHAPGRHGLAVTVRGEHVKGSPFAFTAVADPMAREELAALRDRGHTRGGANLLWDPDTADGYRRAFGKAGPYFRGVGLEPGTSSLILAQPAQVGHLPVPKQLEVQDQYARYLQRQRTTLLHWRISTLPTDGTDGSTWAYAPSSPKGGRAPGPLTPRAPRTAPPSSPRGSPGAPIGSPPPHVPHLGPRASTAPTGPSPRAARAAAAACGGGGLEMPRRARTPRTPGRCPPPRRHREHNTLWEWGGVLMGEAREVPPLDLLGETYLTHRGVRG